MFNLKDILAPLRAAADAKLTGVIANIATLNGDALAFAEGAVAKQLDIPPVVLAIAKGEVPTVEKAVEPFEILGLKLLQARIDALL